MTASKDKWNSIYRRPPKGMPQPCEVLKRYSHLLPESGTALDVACGRGGNALFLSRATFQTTAVDISDNAVAALSEIVNKEGLSLRSVAASIESWLPDVDCGFDVIVVSRFLDRMLFPVLVDSLNRNGLLFYQTFVMDKADPAAGPNSREYLLDANELLSAFGNLTIRAFYDPGSIGRVDEGYRNESYVVAQKVDKT